MTQPPTETRDGIYETARQYASCLLDPQVAAWVTPTPHLPQFKPAEFATSHDTLYLLSKDGGGSASAIIAAAADAVMRAAVTVAERSGGRLDPPALCVLDEAANVCRISDLPDLYSHLGSRGVIPMTILQPYRQGQKCWGEASMDALWSAATIKIIGSGIDDADFADRLSRLIGDHDVQTTSVSTSDSGKSTSVSMRTQRILPPDAIRALPKGRALLLATGIRAAMLNLRPWYNSKLLDVFNDFGDDWRIHREKLAAQIETLGKITESAADAYDGTDQALANALRKVDASYGGSNG